jgi:hypothetical protein
MTVRGWSSTPVPPGSVSRLTVTVPLRSGGACGYGDFEATTASGLRPLLAILATACNLRVGVALVVENFSRHGVGCSHLDFLS